jgi:hypothetical protein
MLKWLSVLLIVLLLVDCKKAFNPPGALSGTNKYLVIDGIINSGSDSTFIKLSRTKKFDTVIVIDHETGAQVSVESDANRSYPLSEINPGTYSAAPLNLDISHKYRLRIKTSDNKEYLSDFVAVKNAPPVDSIGFKALNDGVHIYVNTHDGNNTTRYYRWEYNEDWQFHSFYQSLWIGLVRRQANQFRYNCFSRDVSNSILIGSSAKLSSDVIFQAPIATVPSTSEKIETKYSILVKQYALTIDAYNFWTNLEKNNEQMGSIFDAQPSVNQTNYHCLSNPNEIVVGYLSVGSSSSKRIFITASQLLPGYHPADAYGCQVDTEYNDHAPFYSHPTGSTDPNINDPNSGYTSIEGLFYSPPLPFGVPNAMTYSTTVCDDCTVRGTQTVPAFWK